MSRSRLAERAKVLLEFDRDETTVLRQEALNAQQSVNGFVNSLVKAVLREQFMLDAVSEGVERKAQHGDQQSAARDQ